MCRRSESQVEQVRELDFLRPVAVQPVSAEEIAGKLEGAFDDTYPKEFYDRRTVAWQTLGVIPRDVTIRDALLAFQTGQVVGFYNPVDGELVYRADGDLGLVERVTLAHELTHAIDDQHFDLGAIDGIAARCRDEAFQAALGAVEGSAQFFAVRVLFEFPPDRRRLLGARRRRGRARRRAAVHRRPAAVAVHRRAGVHHRARVPRRRHRGRRGARARSPTTTEQILHPERFPTDRPIAASTCPTLAGDLGPGWGDLDVMQVGEAWLAAMLGLRLDASVAEAAAAGWDGGSTGRSPTAPTHAVVVATAWDTTADADAFAQAVREWFERAASACRGQTAPAPRAFAVTTATTSLSCTCPRRRRGVSPARLPAVAWCPNGDLDAARSRPAVGHRSFPGGRRAGAQPDVPGSLVLGPTHLRSGARRDRAAVVDLRGAPAQAGATGRRRGHARGPHPDRAHARPRRRAARLRERLPPPRVSGGRGRGQQEDAAVRLPRLDLRARRPAAQGARVRARVPVRHG